MEFLLSFLPIVIYFLLIIILVIGIILGVKAIKTVDKIDNVVDDISNKVKSLNGLFHIIDFCTDKIVSISDKIIDGIAGFLLKIFNPKKKNEKESENDTNE